MRILHIGKYLPPFAGGMENFLADLLKAQAASGMRTAALVHNEHSGPRGVMPGMDDRPMVYRAPCFGRLLYAPVSPTFPLWLDRTIKAFEPDLLHLHMPNTSAFAAFVSRNARQLPWVVHWHSDVVASTIDRRLALAYAAYRPFEQRILAASRAIIATSPEYLRSSDALRQWRDKGHVVPLSLDPERIPEPDARHRAHAETLWRGQDLRVLAVGRLTYYKGHETLLKASAQLDGVRTLIVGTGEREASLRETIRNLNLSSKVTLVGFQPNPALNALLASCDVLCLPSMERTEAFGLVLLEAMRFGKAVVASDIPGSGVGWVVREAQNGLLTTPGDEASLAAALGHLRDDPDQRGRLGELGRIALSERFSMSSIANAIETIYESAA